MRRVFFTLAIIAALAAARAACAAPLQETAIPFFEESDTGALVGVSEDGRLYYSIDWANQAAILESPIGVISDGHDLGMGVTLGEPSFTRIDQTFPVRGPHATGMHHCNAAAIPVTHTKTGTQYTVEFRVCMDGAAFRMVIPGKGKRRITGESTAFTFPPGVTFWRQTGVGNYEDEYKSETAMAPDTRVGMPLTVEYPNGWTGAVTESAVTGYSGMTLKALEGNRFQAEFLDDPMGWIAAGDVTTPWRVFLLSRDLNGLVNADLVWALAPPPADEVLAADWIKPGRCLWSWLNGGRSRVKPDEMRMYVDAASHLGYEFVLVDDGWEDPPPVWRNQNKGAGWSTPEKSDMQHMKELVEYARERGVGIWVWKHFELINDPQYRRKYFADLHGIGVVGVKVDFMDSESVQRLQFYDDTLRDAFDHQLMINFHGANKPAGECRRWPNEMSREGIRGLENVFMPETHVTALPFTRLLAGHADYTPMHFKRAFMSNTSWPFQIASAVIFASPVTFYAAYPPDMLANPAREILEKLPVVFDETIVLPQSRIGGLAAFARRSGRVWHIAVMSAGASRKLDIDLSFLGPGEYSVTAALDDPRDPVSLKIARTTVTAADTLPVRLRTFGGFAAVIEPVK